MADAASTVNSAAATSSTSAASSSQSASTLGKDEFLKMLMAQLKYQDPLNPQDGSAFAAQLAQFSSLEQLTNLNNTLTSQSASYTQLMNLESVSMIGKNVEASIVDPSTSQSTTVSGTVSAVQFKDNVLYLTVNNQEVAFSDVVSVK